jgi:hypothetical protein
VKSTASTVLASLDLHLEKQLQRALDVDVHNYAGHVSRAKYLVIGDVGNFKDRQKLWPFYEHGNCSLFLTKAIDEAGFNESQIIYVNINGELGPELVEKTLLTRPSLRVITLGENAQRSFKSLGFGGKSFVLNHPQYYRRFHHNDGLLVRELREIYAHG